MPLNSSETIFAETTLIDGVWTLFSPPTFDAALDAALNAHAAEIDAVHVEQLHHLSATVVQATTQRRRRTQFLLVAELLMASDCTLVRHRRNDSLTSQPIDVMMSTPTVADIEAIVLVAEATLQQQCDDDAGHADNDDLDDADEHEDDETDIDIDQLTSSSLASASSTATESTYPTSATAAAILAHLDVIGIECASRTLTSLMQ